MSDMMRVNLDIKCVGKDSSSTVVFGLGDLLCLYSFVARAAIGYVNR